MLAPFHQHAHHNLGIPSRSVAYEPGIVLILAQAFPKTVSFRVTHNLRAPGFAAKFNALQFDSAPRASFVYYPIHSLCDLLDGVLSQIHMHFTHARRILQQVRLFENSARGDAADRVGDL